MASAAQLIPRSFVSQATPSAAKCAERGCVFPPAPGETLCRQHLEMFAVDESDEEQTEEALEESSSLRANVARPEVLSEILNRNLSTDKGGVFSREVAAERGQYKRILLNARVMQNIREKIRSRKCINCGTGLRPGDVTQRCQTCKDLQSRAKKDLWRRRKASGICARCGQRPARPSKTTCSKCADRIRTYERKETRRRLNLPTQSSLYTVVEAAKIVGVSDETMHAWIRRSRIQFRRGVRMFRLTDKDLSTLRNLKRRWYKKRKHRFSKASVRARARKCQDRRHQLRRSLGLCLCCGAEASGRCFCEKCASRINTRCKERRDRKWKESRLCLQCGRRPAVEGKSKCSACRSMSSECEKSRRAKRKKAGLCTQCGGKRNRPGNLMCVACSRKAGAEKAARREKRERGLSLRVSAA